MLKRPRFINYSFCKDVIRTKKPYTSYPWEAGRTAILIYQLPNSLYLHFSVLKRSMEVTDLPI